MRVIVPIIAAALAAQAAFAQPPEEPEARDSGLVEISAGPSAPTVEEAKAALVTDQGLRPDGPRTETDMAYENRVLGAFRVTQGGQGPLDGGWQVLGSDGVALYTLQLTDPGAGEARIEGAWRNLKLEGPGSSGLIDSVRREGGDIVLGFRDGLDEMSTQLRLRLEANGTWTGETVAGERRTGVLAARAQGLETASMAVPEWRAPPPPKAKAKPKPKRKSKSRSKRR